MNENDRPDDFIGDADKPIMPAAKPSTLSDGPECCLACSRIKKTDLIAEIKAALNTEEDGNALVEVARNAHAAEMQAADSGRAARDI